MPTDWVTLKGRAHRWLCRLSDDGLHAVRSPGRQASDVRVCGDRLVAATAKGRKVAVWGLEGRVPMPWIPATPLPRGARALAATLVGETLFAGGHGPDGEAAWRWADGTWVALPLPMAPRRGKGVDALLVDGERLIGVDNLLMPKWVVAWDVTDPEAARVVVRGDLVMHGTYERVVDAAIGDRLIAVRSRMMGHFGASTAVALLDKALLYNRRSLEAARSWTLPGDSPEVLPDDEAALLACVEMVAAGGAFWFACGRSGLWRLDEADLLANEPASLRRVSCGLEVVVGVGAAPGRLVVCGWADEGEPDTFEVLSL